MLFYSNDISDLKDIARRILDKSKYKVFILKGDLGAGKTSLVREFVQILHSEDNVSSPTFSIVNSYDYPKGRIFHFDLYRIKTEEELCQIGFDEYIESDNLCFIEWGEICQNRLDNFHQISIELDNEQRKIIFN